MSDTNKLEAQARDRVGKGAARELRRNSMVPAVIYGDKKPPIGIALSKKEVTQRVYGGGFMTSILSIDVDGESHQVLPKDYQLHPVTDQVMHVDLLRVSRRTVVTVEIPVNFINEETCPGLKAGGVLNVVRHTVEVNVPATSIPEGFEIDLEPFNVGDSINISSVALPEDVEPTITDRDFTIATIATPAALRSESDDGEEGDAEEGAEEAAGEDEGGEE
jgi:large subunit ribosomal protein L25